MKSRILSAALLVIGTGLISVPGFALEAAIKTQLAAIKAAPVPKMSDYEAILATLSAQDFADALKYLMDDLQVPAADVTTMANSVISKMDAAKQVDFVEAINDTVPDIVISDSSLKTEAKTTLAANKAAADKAAADKAAADKPEMIIDNPKHLSQP